MKTHDVDNLWDNLMDEYFFCKSLRRATEWSYRKVLSGFRKFVGFHRTPDSIVRRDVQEWRRFVLKDQGLTSHTWNNKGKRTARAVLTGMCYSAGSAMRHGSSSLTRLTGQSAMMPSTWRR